MLTARAGARSVQLPLAGLSTVGDLRAALLAALALEPEGTALRILCCGRALPEDGSSASRFERETFFRPAFHTALPLNVPRSIRGRAHQVLRCERVTLVKLQERLFFPKLVQASSLTIALRLNGQVRMHRCECTGAPSPHSAYDV